MFGCGKRVAELASASTSWAQGSGTASEQLAQETAGGISTIGQFSYQALDEYRSRGPG